MKRLFLNLSFFSVWLLLAGCLGIQSPTSLLQPPVIPGENADLTSEINKHIPNQSDVLRAINHTSVEPIIFTDLNGDGENEAIFFYKPKDIPDHPVGVVLKKKDRWEKIAEIEGSGNYLFDLQFADLNGDGKKEIIAGFGYSENTQQYGLLVYDIFSDHTPKLLFNDSYSNFTIESFAPNQLKSLVIFQFIKSKYNTISLHHFENDTLVKKDEIAVDQFINGYEKVSSGLIAPHTTGLMVNAAFGAHSGLTMIFHIENNAFIPLLISSEDSLVTEHPVYSSDTNQDGILEYGILRPSYSETEKSYAETTYLIDYYQLDGELNPHKVGSYYENPTYNFSVRLPAEYEDIQIELSDDYSYTKIIDPQSKEILFDIYITLMEQDFDHRWQLLTKDNELYYLTSKNNPTHSFKFSLMES